MQEAGIASGTKLYALYARWSILGQMQNLTSLHINDDVTADEFVSPGDPIKAEDTTTAAYSQDINTYDIKSFETRFKMNPFVAAAVYKDPWTGALDNGSDFSALGKKTGNVTKEVLS